MSIVTKIHNDACDSSVVAIVGASELNSESFKKLYYSKTFDLLLAADAGLKSLQEIGIVPNCAIGDFDSYGKTPNASSSMEVEKFPEDKDYTDLELALHKSLELGASELFVFGVLGNRLDHEISAMQVMSKASEHVNKIIAIGKHQTCLFMAGPCSVEILASKQDLDKTISIIAMSDICTGLKSQGFKWNYSGSCLKNIQSIGVSNKLISTNASLSLQSGRIIIIY